MLQVRGPNRQPASRAEPVPAPLAGRARPTLLKRIVLLPPIARRRLPRYEKAPIAPERIPPMIRCRRVGMHVSADHWR